MILNRKFRACFITLIFILSVLTVAFIPSETVKARDNNVGSGNKLYFVNNTIRNVGSDVFTYIREYLNFSNLFKRDSESDSIQYEDILEIIKEFLSEMDFLSEGIKITPEMSTDPPVQDEDIKFPPELFLVSPRESELGEFLIWSLLWFFNDLIGDDIEFLESFLGMDLNPFTMTHIYEVQELQDLSGEIEFNLYHSNYLPDRIASKLEDFISSGNYKDNIRVHVSKINHKNEVDITYSSEKVSLENVIFNKVSRQNIIIKTEDLFVNKGDTLEFTIELIPSEKKPIDFLDIKDLELELNGTGFISGFGDILNLAGVFLESIADSLIDRNIDSIKSIGYDLKNTSEELKNIDLSTIISIGEFIDSDDVEINISKFLHDACVASIIYGSTTHPSHVTLPSDISGRETVTYYLHENNQLRENKVDGGENEINLLEETGEWKTETSLSRSKIINNAKAEIYINYYDFTISPLKENINLVATLYVVDGNTETLIASSEFELGRGTTYLFKSNKIVFDFNDINREITHGQDLMLKIEANIDEGILSRFTQNLKLLYNGKDYPSLLSVEYEDTDYIKINSVNNININNFPDIYPIAAGENEFFVLNVSSRYNDDLEVETISLSTHKDRWDEIYLFNDVYNVSQNGYVLIPFYINHTNKDLSAYDDLDSLYVRIKVGGKTGQDTISFLAEISKDGVEYNVEVSDLSTKFVEKGETSSFSFILKNKNTGLWPDEYTLSAEFLKDGWALDYDTDLGELKNFEIDGETLEFTIDVRIPDDTTLETNILMITVTSAESGESFVFNVTMQVRKLSIFEMIYKVFQDAAESMGLDSILGGFAGGFLLFIVLFIILIFVIAAIVIIKKEYMEVICPNRVREISTDEAAEYTITIHNPSNKTMDYEINFEKKKDSEGWKVSLDENRITVKSKGFKRVNLTVDPTEFIESDDWIEVKVTVKTIQKSKIEEFSVITSITDEKPELKIIGMFHWPRAFREGDRVTTSFKLENRGRVAAKNVNVVLKVNGEIKNKVENINIPRGGYAEIEIPWIAEKGKNEVNIEVND